MRWTAPIALLAVLAGLATGGPAYDPKWDFDPDPEVEAVLQEADKIRRLALMAERECTALTLDKSIRLSQARTQLDTARARLDTWLEMMAKVRAR